MRLRSLTLLSILAAGSSSLFADTIPYPNTGTIIPGSTTVTANGGEIDAYFVSYNAGNDDVLYLVDLDTGTRVGPTFPNKTTEQGTFEDFGTYAPGTNLAFEIVDLTINQTFSSDTALSDDGVNHAYTTAFSGGPLSNGQGGGNVIDLPAGTYVGFEDLPAGSSDEDYNDLTFIFTSVTATPPPPSTVPEPSSFIMLGTGLIGAAGMLRRKLAR
jgi:Domain of unknown function (DUF4114)/PEP-CTERM motif